MSQFICVGLRSPRHRRVRDRSIHILGKVHYGATLLGDEITEREKQAAHNRHYVASSGMHKCRYVRPESRGSSQLVWVEYDPQEVAAQNRSSGVRRTKLLRPTQSNQKMESRCRHEQAVASAVAGMGRFICESCGYVSIKLVKKALIRTGIPRPVHEVHGEFL